MRLSIEKRDGKSQIAVDFMVSYGIAILIVAVAVYVVLRVGIFGGNLTPYTCNPSPSFACVDAVLSHNGLLNLVISQATGAQMDITGAACATSPSTTNDLPAYGNIGVQSNSVAPTYYVNSQMNPGLVIYSDTSALITINCYGTYGIASSNLGSTMIGYVWINYTTNSLPSSYHAVQHIVSFSVKSS